MHCKYCGKELYYEANVCEECKTTKTEVHVHVTISSPYNPRMAGFQPALICGIVATVAQILSAAAIALLYSGWFGAIIGLLFLAAALGACVPAAITGVHSISLAVHQKKAGLPMPIATLVLGIVACAFALSTAISSPIYFLIWLIALL